MNRKKFNAFQKISILLVVIILLITVFFICFSVKRYGFCYYKEVKKIAGENNLNANLVMAMIKTESSFQRSVVSSKGAVGFMQLMPKTAEWICEKNNIPFEYNELLNYQKNVDIGCKYFNYLLEKFDLSWAIVAYNAGENNVSEWLKEGLSFDEIPFFESRNYLERVLTNLDYYNSVFGKIE